ncbi:MAG: hypothetical protein ACLFSR_01485 [Halomonas sp.]
MKHHTQRNGMDEREKLRQFRELDDAFAEALRELEPATSAEAPAAASPASNEDFQQRLEALMAQYELSAERVRELVETLKRFDRIA